MGGTNIKCSFGLQMQSYIACFALILWYEGDDYMKVEEILVPESVKRKCKRVYKVYGCSPEFETEAEREEVMKRALMNIARGFEILKELHGE